MNLSSLVIVAHLRTVLTCLQTWLFCRVYEAEIEEIDHENSTAAVTFTGYGNAEIIPLQNLKAVEDRRRLEDDLGLSRNKSRYEQNNVPAYHGPRGSGSIGILRPLCESRKEQIAEQREYKKKKAQKKVLRMKELEQEREDQKSKWQQFNNKAYSKNKKGQVTGRQPVQGVRPLGTASITGTGLYILVLQKKKITI